MVRGEFNVLVLTIVLETVENLVFCWCVVLAVALSEQVFIIMM